MEIKKILSIGLILIMLAFASLAPASINVMAATTDTISITFDPSGNISIEVAPSTYDFGSFWSYSNESTTSSYFTIWNNGTVDNMVTDIRITGSPADFTVDPDSPPVTDDYYALKVLQGSVSANPWVTEAGYTEIDSDIDRSGSDNFGLTLYISNITADHAEQTITVTLQGATS